MDDTTKSSRRKERLSQASNDTPGAVAVKSDGLSKEVASALTTYREARLAAKNQEASSTPAATLKDKITAKQQTNDKDSDNAAPKTRGKSTLDALEDRIAAKQNRFAGSATVESKTAEGRIADKQKKGPPVTDTTAAPLQALEDRIAAKTDHLAGTEDTTEAKPAALPSVQDPAAAKQKKDGASTGRTTLEDLEDRITSKQQQQSEPTANTNSNRGTENANTTLSDLERSVLQKPPTTTTPSKSSLVSEDSKSSPKLRHDPSDNDMEQGYIGVEHNEVYNGANTITATIVEDDETEVWRRAQEDLIGRATIATVAEEGSRSKWRWILGILLLVLLVVLAGTCGAGYCTSTLGEQPEARARAIVEFVNSVTLRGGEPIQYPFEAVGDEDAPPEEDALKFVILSDPEQLSAEHDKERLLQRYALALLWFGIGRFADIENVHSSKLWLVGNNECDWSGVQCDFPGGQVTSINVEWEEAESKYLPPDIGLLSQLTTFSMPNSQLSSTLPSTLQHLTNLRHLHLKRNKLTGSIPSALAALTELTHLDLVDNKFTSTVPEELFLLSNLEHLGLTSNSGINGTVPDFLGDFAKLESLSLGFTSFSGSVPLILQEMTQLTHLVIGSATFEAPTPDLSFFAGLSNLKIFAYDNLDGGALPNEIGEWWPQMEDFSVTRQNVNGTLPAGMANWSNLKNILLPFNALSGSIPPALFAAWTNLESAILGWNSLSGAIPTEIGLLTNVNTLVFQSNKIEGPIPSEIGLLTNLEVFNFNDNQLTGTIPLESLQIPNANFFLERNNLNGTAP